MKTEIPILKVPIGKIVRIPDDSIFGLGGSVKKSHLQSQKIWYRPWTWSRKPIQVIDELDIQEVLILPPENTLNRREPQEPVLYCQVHGESYMTIQGKCIACIEAPSNLSTI